MPEAAYGRATFWLTCIVLDESKARHSRETVRQHLESLNIEARPVWKPMHLQPIFAAARRVGGDVAAALFAHGLCLPSGSSLTDDDQDRVINALTHILA